MALGGVVEGGLVREREGGFEEERKRERKERANVSSD